MKNLRWLYSLLTSLVFLYACEPSRAENGDYLNGLQTPSEGNNLPKLTKIQAHSFDEDTGDWDDDEVLFTYQNKILSAFTENGGTAKTITYNAANKIYKIAGDGETTTFDYTNGQLISISSDIAGVISSFTTFSFNAGMVSKTVSVQEFTLPLPMKIYLETTYEYSGPNLAKAIVKSGIYLTDGTLQMNPDPQTLTFSYDNKKTPYQLLPKEFVYYWSATAPQGIALSSANNFNKFSTTEGSTTQSTTYSYLYNSADYPVEMREPNGGFMKFEYQ